MEKKKERNYWTKNICYNEALKYKSRTEFSNNSRGAYGASVRNGWIEYVCGHMISNFIYWSKEKCYVEALKYNNRTDFYKQSPLAYSASIRHKWIDDVCSHMRYKHFYNHWNKERCYKEALKYNTRKEFQDNSGSAYNSALRNKWLNDICKHMIVLGNKLKRCIYAAEFENNYVYVGLTFNYSKRINDHMCDKRSQVLKHSSSYNILPKFIQLTDYLDVNLSKIEEGFFLEKYKNNGWCLLNIADTGAIGGGYFLWTKVLCEKESLKYTTKIDFLNNSKESYMASYRNGWLDEICLNMKQLNYHTKEDCSKEALKYKTRKEFANNSSAYYTKAIRNKWLNDICQHMPTHAPKSIK